MTDGRGRHHLPVRRARAGGGDRRPRGGEAPRTDPGGVSRTVEYTPEGFVDEVALAGPGGPIDVFDYQGHDALGSPATLTTSEGVTSYDYDALSRLRRVTQPGSGVVTALSYDAQDARYRRDETGSPVSLFFGEWVEYRGGEVVRLVHGGGLDHVLAEVADTDVRQLLTDASNNVTHVASAAPSVYERRYEAFGIVRSSRDPVAVERGFAGRPREGSTGLLYLRARHYDPATGRFLQADPLGIQGDQLYAYAASNPMVFADPLGLRATILDDPLGFEKTLPNPTSVAPGTGARSKGPGEWLYPEGVSHDDAFDTIIAYGVAVDRDEFRARVETLGVIGYYNPRNGLGPDVLEAAGQKFAPWDDPFARQFAADLAGLQHPVRILAHSQGTLTLANALQFYGLRLPEGSRIRFISPAISYPPARAAANAAGVQLEEGDYYLPYGDAAALWAPSPNPLKILLGTWDLLLGAPVHRGTDP